MGDASPPEAECPFCRKLRRENHTLTAEVDRLRKLTHRQDDVLRRGRPPICPALPNRTAGPNC